MTLLCLHLLLINTAKIPVTVDTANISITGNNAKIPATGNNTNILIIGSKAKIPVTGTNAKYQLQLTIQTY